MPTRRDSSRPCRGADTGSIAPVQALPTAEVPAALSPMLPASASQAAHAHEHEPTKAAEPPKAEEIPARWRASVRWLALSALAVAALVTLHVAVRPRVEQGVCARYSIILPDEYPLASADAMVPPGEQAALGISRDGRRLAYVARSARGIEIRVRDNGTGKVVPVPGTAGGRTPLFSPDGARLAFFAGDHSKTVSLEAGIVSEVAEAQQGEGGAWADDGFIYFSLLQQEGVFKVADTGGAVIAVPGGSKGRRPVPLERGRDVAVTLGKSEMGWIRDGRLHEVGLGFAPRYAPTGHLLYALPQRLVAVPFDRASLQMTGRPVVVARDLRTADYVAQFDVADDGTLVYAPLDSSPAASSRLTVVTHAFDELRRRVPPGR